MLPDFIRTPLAVISLSLWLLPTAQAFDHDHVAWTDVLRTHVVDGKVDYAALAEQPAALQRYLTLLGAVTDREITNWPKPAQLAFWINAYNALALDTVLAHYPLKRRGLRGFAYPSASIQQISNVWKTKRRSIGGELRALDDIEHGIIRPTFKEPRIHFALVCAAVSCPKLRSEAYRASDLEQQLTVQTSNFLADTARGLHIDDRRQRITLSSIFKWFSEDFPLPSTFDGELAGNTKQAGVIYFVSQAAPPAAQVALRSQRYRVTYLDYDWALNAQ